jgi:hypothetical protein
LYISYKTGFDNKCWSNAYLAFASNCKTIPSCNQYLKPSAPNDVKRWICIYKDTNASKLACYTCICIYSVWYIYSDSACDVYNVFIGKIKPNDVKIFQAFATHLSISSNNPQGMLLNTSFT